MKLNTATSGDIVTSGNMESRKFGANINGKAFRLFSDTIYKNKIGSIVRELGCNALDAQKTAGRGDIPFEVHLPTIFEPYFSIKDTGVGMSHDDVMGVYSTYFESTKDNSNDSIGAFGLGSKTPFSYTDSFTVVSTHNGVRRHYAAMTDSNGEPSVNLLHTEICKEPNGVEVQINVKENDFRFFVNEVRKQYRLFKVKPTIHNSDEDFDWHELTVVDSYGKFDRTQESGFFVEQGEVGYPLNISHIQQFAAENDNIHEMDRLFSFFNAFNGGILHFDIGDIEVTVSREDISYSEYTVNNILEFIREVSPIVTDTVIKKLESLNNDWERVAHLNENPGDRIIFNISGKTFGKDGNFGDGHGVIDKSYQRFKFADQSAYFYSDTNTNVHTPRFRFYRITDSKNRWDMGYYGNVGFEPDSKTEFFIRDKTRMPIARIKQYYNQNGYDKKIILVELNCKNGPAGVTDEIIENFSKAHGNVTVRRISDLPEIPKSALSRLGPALAYYVESNSTVLPRSMRGWERLYDVEDLDSAAYFVYDDYHNYANSIPKYDLLRTLMRHGKIDLPIVGVKDSRASKFEGNDDFIKLDDYLDELLNKEYSEESGMQSLLEKQAIVNYIRSEFRDISAFPFMHGIMSNMEDDDYSGCLNIPEFKNLDRSHTFKKYFRIMDTINRYSNTVSKRVENMDAFTVELFGQEKSFAIPKKYENFIEEFSKEMNSFCESYPLLKGVGSSYYYMDKNDAIRKMGLACEYIMALDMFRDKN